MQQKWFRLSILVLILTLFTAACSSIQAAQSAAPAAAQSAQSNGYGSAPQAQPTTSAGNATSSGDLIQCAIVAGKSVASYQVREQLASLNFPSDAIGKTDQITGMIGLKPDGSIDTAVSKFTVDLASLQSDKSMRDNFLRRAVLHTDQYPQAVFVPTQVTGLSLPLKTGDVSFKVTGDMTIQNVTRPVTWDVTGNFQGNTATGKATTTFTFEDFNLNQPHVATVLSIVDKITLNVDLTMQKLNN
jgi:polyisoprenoid-binding protein YceI